MSAAKILIVDDSEIVLDLVAMYLEDGGYEVTTLDNAVQIPAMMETDPPDLVLLDVFMPGLRGDEAVLLLQRVSERRIPILLHSDMDEKELAQTVRDTGASGYLVKTMDPDEILEKVKPWLTPGEPPSEPSGLQDE